MNHAGVVSLRRQIDRHAVHVHPGVEAVGEHHPARGRRRRVHEQAVIAAGANAAGRAHGKTAEAVGFEPLAGVEVVHCANPCPASLSSSTRTREVRRISCATGSMDASGAVRASCIHVPFGRAHGRDHDAPGSRDHRHRQRHSPGRRFRGIVERGDQACFLGEQRVAWKQRGHMTVRAHADQRVLEHRGPAAYVFEERAVAGRGLGRIARFGGHPVAACQRHTSRREPQTPGEAEVRLRILGRYRALVDPEEIAPIPIQAGSRQLGKEQRRDGSPGERDREAASGRERSLPFSTEVRRQPFDKPVRLAHADVGSH